VDHSKVGRVVGGAGAAMVLGFDRRCGSGLDLLDRRRCGRRVADPRVVGDAYGVAEDNVRDALPGLVAAAARGGVGDIADVAELPWQIPESGVAGTKPASILFAIASILAFRSSRPATPGDAKTFFFETKQRSDARRSVRWVAAGAHC